VAQLIRIEAPDTQRTINYICINVTDVANTLALYRKCK
jgi:hypothetical protein